MAAAAPPLPASDRSAHPYHTYDMIREIPATVRETHRRLETALPPEVAHLADRSFLVFTGSGTAFYAARLAESFASASPSDRIRSVAVTAFALSHYGPRIGRSTGVVGVSHSGITKTTVDALRAARSRGARTVGLTHFADRPISEAADATFVVGNGPDLSRCHTKCFAAGALAAAELALDWRLVAGRESPAEVDRIRRSLEALPLQMEDVLRGTEPIGKDLARAHIDRRSVAFLGSGPNLATAYEAALKVRETSFLPALGMEIEDFLHGSWQSLEPDRLVFVMATQGASRARAGDLVRAAHTVGAHVVALVSEGDRELDEAADETISLPRVDELVSPFLNIIPLYWFAYFSSVERGHNPDLLRYLDPTYWQARQIVFPPGTH